MVQPPYQPSRPSDRYRSQPQQPRRPALHAHLSRARRHHCGNQRTGHPLEGNGQIVQPLHGRHAGVRGCELPIDQREWDPHIYGPGRPDEGDEGECGGRAVQQGGDS
ncbi:hypothetical protein PpBr36_08747 [Pyricularia pennisetigena]|uniref:hypothetical protein n=1 Tax=Pyricularia pennisetigena TaxID=1578925 RepID=UPI00114E4C26|nr:hypothetical protein PpBr36_08747 [Pyricularia pennisetigena]TLS23938.1 hypothetical protein PpBr36_08747 [Pyricularia pennisetigena]